MEDAMRIRTGLFCLAALLCSVAVSAGDAAKPAADSKEEVFKRGVPFFIGDVKVEEGNKVTVSISSNPAAPVSGGLLALHPEHPILQITFITEGDGVRSARTRLEPGNVPSSGRTIARTITNSDFASPRDGQKIVLSLVIFPAGRDLLEAMDRNEGRLVSNELDIAPKLK